MTIRVKIGGGLRGLDPNWKAANPHCKHRIKKLGGSGFDPPPLALIPQCHYNIILNQVYFCILILSKMSTKSAQFRSSFFPLNMTIIILAYCTSSSCSVNSHLAWHAFKLLTLSSDDLCCV